MKIRTKLLIAPILTTAVFAAGGAVIFENFQSVIEANKLHVREMDELEAVSKIPRDLDKIRGTIGELLLGEIRKEELEKNWQDYDKDSSDLKIILSQLAPSSDDDDEKISSDVSEESSMDMFQEMSDNAQTIRMKSDEIVKKYEEGDVEMAKAIYADVDENFVEADGVLGEMADDNMKELGVLRGMIEYTQNRAQLLIVVMLAGSALIGLALSLLNSGRILRELRSFRDTVSEILKGDLNKRILAVSKDEVGDLASAFNEMVARLQESHSSLEKKIRERTQELEEAKENVEEKVREQTKKLQEQNVHLDDTRKAVLNILEDVAESEKDLRKKTVELQKATTLIDQQRERAEGILRFLKSIGDGVVATDLEGKIIFFNEAAEQLAGISSEQAMGKYTHEVLAFFKEKSPDTQYNVIQSFLKGESVINKLSDRFFLKRKDGSTIFMSFSPTFIYDTHKVKQGCILVMRDVTAERELEKTKDNFLSVAAHQLRTPLSGIRWSLEMILGGDAGKLSKEAMEVVENINENNLRLIALVNDLLDVSRINQGKDTDPAKPTNVSETIVSVIKSAKEFAAKNKISLTCKDCKKLNVEVMISPQRFFEALENIVSNAIKYTPEEGTVKIAVTQKDGKVEIAVSDSGIGIPKGEQGKIFSKFFRAENAVHKDPEGSGLGLSVVKSFIEEAGGDVSFQSIEGTGTTFFIDLPIYGESK